MVIQAMIAAVHQGAWHDAQISLPATSFRMSFDLPICFQYFVDSCALFARAIVCFQYITDSFWKKRGVGYPSQYGYEPAGCLKKGGKISPYLPHRPNPAFRAERIKARNGF